MKDLRGGRRKCLIFMKCLTFGEQNRGQKLVFVEITTASVGGELGKSELSLTALSLSPLAVVPCARQGESFLGPLCFFLPQSESPHRFRAKCASCVVVLKEHFLRTFVLIERYLGSFVLSEPDVFTAAVFLSPLWSTELINERSLKFLVLPQLLCYRTFFLLCFLGKFCLLYSFRWPAYSRIVGFSFDLSIFCTLGVSWQLGDWPMLCFQGRHYFPKVKDSFCNRRGQ